MGISACSHVEIRFYINSEKGCAENDTFTAILGRTVLPGKSVNTGGDGRRASVLLAQLTRMQCVLFLGC